MCRASADSIVAAVKPNYPTETIVDTKIVKVLKVWTNDSAITVSCSALDENMVITVAPYR